VTYHYGKNNTSYVRYGFYTPDGRYDGNFFVDLNRPKQVLAGGVPGPAQITDQCS
jgi:hypothetical protein